MRRAKRTLAILALTTTLVGCSSATMPANTPAISPETLQIYTTSSTRPLINSFAPAYSELFPNITLESRSANYDNLRSALNSGEMPYFVTNHLPQESALWSAPIGQDALTIIAHPDFPLTGLSLDELRAIYQGRFQDLEMGANMITGVVLLSREDGSGTRAEFERLVMGERTILQASRVASSSQSMIDGVANTPNAIGFVSMGYLNATGQNTRVKVLAVDAVIPSQATIIDSTYPLRNTIFVIGNVEPQGANRQFVTWAQSPAGQMIVSRHYAPFIP